MKTTWRPAKPGTDTPGECVPEHGPIYLPTATLINPYAGNWEGGYTDRNGQRWMHVPWVGWRRDSGNPFLRQARRRRLLRLGRVVAASLAGAYLGAMCCAAAGTLFGALIREALR